MNEKTLTAEFIEYMNQIDGEFSDFYITKTGSEKLSALIGNNNAKSFDIIGAHSSHSLICRWGVQKGVTVDEQPIVWLDSEGTLNSVFAQNIEGFVSLLPYDTGCIYDIISAWIYHEEDPDSVPIPSETYTSDVLDEFLESARGRYDAYGKFINWLKNHEIKICTDPVNVIGKAIKGYPKLSKWLKM